MNKFFILTLTILAFFTSLFAEDSNKSDGYMLDLMKDIYDMGYSVFAFDLRAHGDSGGKDLGLAYIEKKDLDAAIHQIKLNHNVTDINTLKHP